MTALLSDQNQEWLDHFRQMWKRDPTVLLIGNIANNAYNNAKILNEAGLDCDVICYDYYHVMGCPEWEDADLISSPADDFRPDWTRLDMSGYKRPRWFAQGPMLECIEYLISRRTRSTDEHRRWRQLLIYSFSARPVYWREWVARTWLQWKKLTTPLRIRLHAWLRQEAPWLYAVLRRLRMVTSQRHIVAQQHQRPPADVLVRVVTTPKGPPPGPVRSAWLIKQFVLEFPDRTDRLGMNDMKPYIFHQARWEYLMSFYDIVIGFSTDPFWPLLCGKPYFAVEHGTLRDIPFVDDAQGRRTALAYRLAEHCFVTNFDCADSAQKLAPGRYTLINHPYDEDHGLSVTGAEEQRAQLQRELDCDFLFFHPTRQDWVEGTGYADKRNEVFLHAFAALRRRGIRVGLVACSWGANVPQSQQLLDELGCSAHVRWMAPLAITPFERMCKACDVVADQFKLGAFGGVVFKAMAVGTPIVTFLNEGLIIRQYPEIPPVINCRSVADIEAATIKLVQQPQLLADLGRQSREWICRHHGKRETINKQVDQFRRHLPILSGDSAIAAS